MNKLQDVEAKLLDFSGIIDEIKLVNYAVTDKGLSGDRLQNILLGLETLYALKFDLLWEEYEKLTREYYRLYRRTNGVNDER